jgi:activator of HSP90 ATPase
MENVFPKIVKSVETYLFDEEGSIPRSKLVHVGSMVLLLGMVLGLDAFAKHSSHSSHQSHSSHSSGSGGHVSHVSHSSHVSGSHSSHSSSSHSSHSSGAAVTTATTATTTAAIKTAVACPKPNLFADIFCFLEQLKTRLIAWLFAAHC